MKNAQRRTEARSLREQGRAAFIDGKHEQQNPYLAAANYMDAQHWWEGYDQARREAADDRRGDD